MPSVPEIARRFVNGAWRTTTAEEGNGGSQPVQVVLVPLSFDDPAIAPPGNGVPLYTPEVGDLILAMALHITTAWDGDNPIGYVLPIGADQNIGQVVIGGIDMTSVDVDEAGTGDVFDTNSSIIDAMGAHQHLVDVFATTTPLAFKIDNNGGSDPGSSQGEGYFVLAIARSS